MRFVTRPARSATISSRGRSATAMGPRPTASNLGMLTNADFQAYFTDPDAPISRSSMAPASSIRRVTRRGDRRLLHQHPRRWHARSGAPVRRRWNLHTSVPFGARVAMAMATATAMAMVMAMVEMATRSGDGDGDPGDGDGDGDGDGTAGMGMVTRWERDRGRGRLPW
jgi:hypothetical protein